MPPKRESIVATSRPSIAAAAVPREQRDDVGRHALDVAAPDDQQRSSVPAPSRTLSRDADVEIGDDRLDAADELTGHIDPQAKKIRSCVLAITSAMPLVKPMITGRGMYLTAEPVPVRPMIDQHHAGHHRAHEQAVDAVPGDDAGDHHHERAGRSADLEARSAKRGNQEAGDDGAVDAGLRRQARRDRERHRQRQRDQADGHAGDRIRGERRGIIVGKGLHRPRHPSWQGFRSSHGVGHDERAHSSLFYG